MGTEVSLQGLEKKSHPIIVGKKVKWMWSQVHSWDRHVNCAKTSEDALSHVEELVGLEESPRSR